MLAFNQGSVRRGMAELYTSSYAVDLVRRHNRRGVFTSNQAHDIRQAKDPDALHERQMHENVPGEERYFQGHTPVLPLAYGRITGKEILNFAARQTLRSLLLLVGSNRQNKPLGVIKIEWQRILRQGGMLVSEG